MSPIRVLREPPSLSALATCIPGEGPPQTPTTLAPPPSDNRPQDWEKYGGHPARGTLLQRPAPNETAGQLSGKVQNPTPFLCPEKSHMDRTPTCEREVVEMTGVTPPCCPLRRTSNPRKAPEGSPRHQDAIKQETRSPHNWRQGFVCPICKEQTKPKEKDIKEKMGKEIRTGSFHGKVFDHHRATESGLKAIPRDPTPDHRPPGSWEDGTGRGGPLGEVQWHNHPETNAVTRLAAGHVAARLETVHRIAGETPKLECLWYQREEREGQGRKGGGLTGHRPSDTPRRLVTRQLSRRETEGTSRV